MKPTTDWVAVNNDTGSDGASTRVSRPRSGSKKSNKKKKSSKEPMSGWGCLLRSVIFTLVLFAAYVFFGLLLDAMQ